MLSKFPVNTHVPHLGGFQNSAQRRRLVPPPDQLCFRLPGQLSANGLNGRVPSLCPPGLLLAVANLLVIYHSRALTREGDTRDRRRQGGRHA